MKRIFTLLVLICTFISSWAYDAEINGIYYNLISKGTTAEVTSGDSKYTGEVVIPSTITYNGVTYSVTTIGESAFWGCAGLTSVNIPNSVTSIGDWAFSNSKLTSINIPNSVTSIGHRAFANCDCLPVNGVIRYADTYLVEILDKTAHYIEIKKGTRFIGDAAFMCSSVRDVNIPNSVTSIGDEAFNCCEVQSVTIPNSVTKIGDRAFFECYSLSSINIPNSVNYIGDDAFAFCQNLPVIDGVRYADTYVVEFVDDYLTDVEIKEGTRFIGGSMLYNSGSNMTSVSIPNTVTSIGNYAFSGCSCLTSITIPNSVLNIGDYVFSGCSSLTSVTNLSITPQVISSNVFDDNYGTLHVLSGCGNTYREADFWKEFTIVEDAATPANSGICGAEGDNVKWYYYEDTKKLVFIGSGAMAGYGYKNTPWYSFCNSIESVEIQNGVTSIGERAFYDCSGLTSVTIPNSVTSIEYSAFSGCSGLTSVTIPNSVTSIGSYAFYGCWDLTSVTIPNSVTSIGEHAFDHCWDLTSVTIPNSVTSIGSGAFYDCYSLTSVTIPNSVTSIGNAAFHWCSGLTSVTIPNSVTSIGEEAFSYCRGLTSVTIPNSVTSIGNFAFSYCSGLTSVTIPNSVTSIGQYAFSGCSSLTSVTIPNSVTSIGWNAFYNCSSLTSVTNLAETPQGIYYDTFSTYGTLYVPNGSKAAYAATANWSKFNIVELLSFDIALVDGQTYERAEEMVCDNLTYTRNFKNTSMQALFVPFEMSYADWADNFVVYTLNNVTQFDTDGDELLDATTLYVERVTEGHVLKANYPYIIMAKKTGEYTFHISRPTLFPSTNLQAVSCSTFANEYVFQGTYTPFSGMYEQHAYALAGGELAKAGSPTAKLNPYRWYVTIHARDSQYAEGDASEAKSFRIVVMGEDEDEETIITDFTEDAVPVEYVGINGLRSATPIKGLNIVKMSDGSTRKMLIK